MAACADTNFGNEQALQAFDSSAASRFEVPGRDCGRSVGISNRRH